MAANKLGSLKHGLEKKQGRQGFQRGLASIASAVGGSSQDSDEIEKRIQDLSDEEQKLNNHYMILRAQIGKTTYVMHVCALCVFVFVFLFFYLFIFFCEFAL